MEAKAVDADAIFKVFTACANDPKTLLLDVRPQKEYKKGHINQAFNPRLATNGKFLADYSGAQYSMPWSQDCWWGKPVIVYGPPSLAKDHPIIKFLAEQQRCTSVSYFKQGYDVFATKYPFLCTTSVKANSYKKYPSLILPGFLYLGDWGDAEQQERLQELKIKRVVTVHNHPERLRLPAGVKHLKIELADIGSADISTHFNAVFEFLAEAERLKQAALVHCGAGVSRSACLVIMYLMRSKRWSAQQARQHCIAARSLVCPNDGFWQVLCALEGPLGILDRSDPHDTQGFAGADAPAAPLDAQAAGLPVQVRMLSAKEVRMAEEAAKRAAALAAAAAEAEAKAAAEAEAQAAEAEAQAAAEAEAQAAEAEAQAAAEAEAQAAEAEARAAAEEAEVDAGAAAEAAQAEAAEQPPQQDEQAAAAAPVRRELEGKQPHATDGGRSRSPSTSGSSSSSDSSSSGSSSSSSDSDSDSDSSGGSRERPKLRRPARTPEPQAQGLRRPARSRSRSRSREAGRDRNRSRSRSRSGSRDKRRDRGSAGRGRARSRSRSRDRAKAGRQGAGREQHNGAHKRSRSRSRSGGRSRNPLKRSRHGKSRSRSRGRGGEGSSREAEQRGAQHRDNRGRSDARYDSRQDSRQQDRHAAAGIPADIVAKAAAIDAAAAAAAAAALEPEQPQQSGWLVKLEVLKPEGMVGHLLLGPMNVNQRVVFGRAPSCNVVLEHLSISRQHAQLTVDLSGSVCVMDLGSQHGTKLNDAWLKSQQQRTMGAGATVQFGASTRKYKLLGVQKF